MSDEDRKSMLRDVINNVVDGNDEQTQVDFHQYATSKLQSMLGYEPVDTDEEEYEDVDVEDEGEGEEEYEED